MLLTGSRSKDKLLIRVIYMSNTAAKLHEAVQMHEESHAHDHHGPIRDNVEMKKIRHIVADLFQPNPMSYWAELLITAPLGWAALVLFSFLPWGSFLGFLLLVASSFAAYRALSFNHDLSHSHAPWTRSFSFVWNILSGIPFFQPTSMYGVTHLEHHAIKVYATEQDPRYVPVGRGPRSGFMIPMIFHNWIVPFFLMLRFFIIAPISLVLMGNFRDSVIKHSSTLKMNLKHVRRLPNEKLARIARIQELTNLLIWGSLADLWLMGILPGKFFVGFYLINGMFLTYHYTRSLCLHRYNLEGDGNLTMADVMLDSVSFNRPKLLVTLLCPINTCYHSLHHLLPALPYHNLPEAHRRLVKELDPGHPYVRSFTPSMITVFKDLWDRCGRNQKAVASQSS
jgi:fatty acid desaturase